jgi:hypothetical protein
LSEWILSPRLAEAMPLPLSGREAFGWIAWLLRN